ncbi:hypothetical protein ACE38V_11690 [Cytobacillus sp. Hz8]
MLAIYPFFININTIYFTFISIKSRSSILRYYGWKIFKFVTKNICSRYKSRKNKYLFIEWQLARYKIFLNDILEVYLDDTYGGKEEATIRIGAIYGTNDRIVIKTKKETYILFINNIALLKKINE